MTMFAALTLLPAVLGFVGRGIDRLALPNLHRSEGGGRASFWHRWSRLVQRYPIPAAIVGAAILIALALPVFTMRLGFADAGNRPESDTTRRAYDMLSEGFGPGFNGPFIVAAETPAGDPDRAVLEDLAETLRQTPGVQFVSGLTPNEDGTAAILQVIPTTAPQDEETSDLVSHLRDDVIPAETTALSGDIALGGVTAAAMDFAAYTWERMPIFIGAVLALSFLLLLVVFRSVLVPLKAVVMNLLSIGAAYGVIVMIFQWGWGLELIGGGRPGPIEAWSPIMLFAVVFGLSMDYEVFLLSRIREEYDRSNDNSLAVADGLATTARVITAAAAIMVVVFGSFVLGDDRALQLTGLGLATAVFLDATVVRLILVPATMELLGRLNWWFPRWLDRVTPRVHVEAEPDVVCAVL
jgi:RND superfamily putative drug exporter